MPGLRPGMRMRSVVSIAEVVVVKAPGVPVDLRCGGHPMVARSDDPVEMLDPDPDMVGALAAGKRYASGDGSLEVMVTKPGDGILSLGGVALERKDAKPLPSSD